MSRYIHILGLQIKLNSFSMFFLISKKLNLMNMKKIFQLYFWPWIYAHKMVHKITISNKISSNFLLICNFFNLYAFFKKYLSNFFWFKKNDHQEKVTTAICTTRHCSMDSRCNKVEENISIQFDEHFHISIYMYIHLHTHAICQYILI